MRPIFRLTVCAVIAAASSVALASPAAMSATSAYKLPASGKWKIQHIFENTTGGSMTVSKSKTSVTALKLTVGPDYVEDCGTVVEMRGKTAIKRLSTAKRPAVGRVSAGSSLIKPKQVSFVVKGQNVNADVLILWEKTGRRALTAQVSSGDCRLRFALRK